MSGIHYRNGGYITTAPTKQILNRPRGTATANWSYWPSYNDAKTSIIDRSTSAISVTNGGVVSSTLTPFSGTNYGSIQLDNTGDYFDATSSNFTFGTGDFTIMGWFRFSTLNAYSCVFEGATAGGSRINSFVFWVNNSGKVNLFHNGVTQFTGTTTISSNTWTHIALIRNNGVTKCYINGTYELQISTVMDVTTNFCRVGRLGDNAQGFAGYVSDYTVVKGYAVYTDNFTPNSVTQNISSMQVALSTNTSTYGVYKL